MLITHTTYKTKDMDHFVLMLHNHLKFHLKVKTKEKEESLCVASRRNNHSPSRLCGNSLHIHYPDH